MPTCLFNTPADLVTANFNCGLMIGHSMLGFSFVRKFTVKSEAPKALRRLLGVIINSQYRL
jgi:hypothetical protein